MHPLLEQESLQMSGGKDLEMNVPQIPHKSNPFKKQNRESWIRGQGFSGTHKKHGANFPHLSGNWILTNSWFWTLSVYDVCACVCVHVQTCMCMSVCLCLCVYMPLHAYNRGHLAGVTSLLPLCWSQGSNSGCQAWWQSSEPSIYRETLATWPPHQMC